MVTNAIGVARVLRRWGDEYARKDFTNKSASLSFYTLVSIFPLVLVLVTFLGHFVPQEVLIRETMDLIDQFFPLQNPVIVTGLKALFAKRATFGWFGALALLLSSRLLYLNLERAVNDLLETDRRRTYLLRRLFFLVWLVGTMLVLLTPLLFGMANKVLAVFDRGLPSALASRGVFLLASFIMFSCAALILPTRKISLGRVGAGGLLFSGALVAGQIAFKTLTARSLAQYNFLYGSLASLILGSIWIFYFFQLFLLVMYWTGRRGRPGIGGDSA